MITIYWHCLGMTEADETFVNSALQELAQHLKEYPKEDPIKLEVNINGLTEQPELAKEVDEKLNRLSDESYTFSSCAGDIQYVFSKFDFITENCSARLLVCCSSDSQIAKAAQKHAPWACWGATCGFLSAAYPPKDQLKSKFTIWHETVHLLLLRDDNRDECYEPYPPYPKKADCNCDTCIMQFEPDEKWGGKWSLCGKIIGFLQDLSKNCRENKQG